VAAVPASVVRVDWRGRLGGCGGSAGGRGGGDRGREGRLDSPLFRAFNVSALMAYGAQRPTDR
jgi:hypothetical protein